MATGVRPVTSKTRTTSFLAIARRGREHLPARSTSAAHTGDVAAPTQFFDHLIGIAVEKMHLSVYSGQEPRINWSTRHGGCGIKRWRSGLFADSRR